MYLCYLDESGTPEDPATKHFVLSGVAIPAESWKQTDADITAIKTRFGLDRSEIHTGWMLRSYNTQDAIPGFDTLSWSDRRAAIQARRTARLAGLVGNPRKLERKRLFYRKTHPYIHLTRNERRDVVFQIARAFAANRESRMFGGAINKDWFNAVPNRRLPMFEFAFDSIVNRFQAFLSNRAQYISRTNPSDARRFIGLLVQDNNPTVAKRLTALMRRFQVEGTFFRTIDRIIETPFFVDSQLTSMVQVADIAAYAVRRYLDNSESELFDIFYARVDRARQTPVGLRHYCHKPCPCKICLEHGASPFSIGAALSQ